MPTLRLAGVEQLALVVTPLLRGRYEALNQAQPLPNPDVTLFDEVENAVAWLQQTAPPLCNGRARLPRPAVHEAELTHLIDLLAQHLHEAPALAVPKPRS